MCSRVGCKLVGVRGKMLVPKTELVFPRACEKLGWSANSQGREYCSAH